MLFHTLYAKQNEELNCFELCNDHDPCNDNKMITSAENTLIPGSLTMTQMSQIFLRTYNIYI